MNAKDMITKDCIESAYCFFHQKWRVYKYSNNLRQKDDIEYSIASYVESMNRQLYETIAEGKSDFLTDHTSFATDMQAAINRLDTMAANTEQQ